MPPPRLPPPDRWRRYMTDYDEGLGLVYERIVLNDFLEGLIERFPIQTVLEAPIFGMAGVTGINSFRLAARGAKVTLVDSLAERLSGVRRIWGELELQPRLVLSGETRTLPFADHSFDLTWNWAALWYLRDAEAWLGELVRVSRGLVLIAMPNRLQVGYLLRKYLLEREFVRYVDESWADAGRIKRVLRSAGARIVEEGVLDVPPWPDTVMPAAQVLEKVGIRSKRFSGSNWEWSTMDYYLGRRPELKGRIERYMFLERAPLPWQLKSIWAHHRYVLAAVN